MFIIEIEDCVADSLYKIKNFNSLVFDDYGLDKLPKVSTDDCAKLGDIIISGDIRAVITRVGNSEAESKFAILYEDGCVEEFDSLEYEGWERTGKNIKEAVKGLLGKVNGKQV